MGKSDDGKYRRAEPEPLDASDVLEVWGGGDPAHVNLGVSAEYFGGLVLAGLVGLHEGDASDGRGGGG